MSPSTSHPLGVAIIGGGPAGLAVAATIHDAGFDYTLFEQGPIAHHIAQYPTFMKFFSTNANLEIDGFPLATEDDKPTRREYIAYLSNFARYHQLHVQTHSPIVSVQRGADGIFAVGVARPGGRIESIRARAVVMAVGAWDAPRRLTVPGADLPKVLTRFHESHDFIGRRVLVVGGRNSAVEAALQLWRAGAKVSLSYRRMEFDGVGLKYWLRPDIENRLDRGEITGYLGSEVERIDWESVTLRLADGRRETIANDVVLTMLGFDPPVEFLRACGVQLEPGSNRPIHDPDTLETPTPGLFVAGVITNGNISGHVFIENSRHHGELILPRLRERMRDEG